jgi:UDP-N-acetylglucosamine:LPS N-acetylglucosamine transferase
VSKRILIVSARIGAGHDGAARELARRLTGYRVEHADFLDLLPGSLGSRLCSAYHRQLEIAPRSWDWLLGALGSRLGSAAAIRASAMACGRLRALIGADTALVVSTYPMASHALGHLRRRGQLRPPAAVYLTDPSVHRLCISPAADLHITPNATAARDAQRLGAGWVEVASPVVRPEFRPVDGGGERAEARGWFDLPTEPRLALVVAGSWGVGEVEQITRDVADSGAARPVVVCGRNSELQHRLRQAGFPHVFGWVDDMARLMRACDLVVQNAGGLTTCEALATRLPVLTYRCLPGHGRANARILHDEGLVPWIRLPGELAGALATARPSTPPGDQDPIIPLEKLLATTETI